MNPQPTVLETATLPIELPPYLLIPKVDSHSLALLPWPIARPDAVVMIASLIIALTIFVMDFGFQAIMNLFYKMLA